MAEINFDGDASKYAEGDPILNLSQEKRAFIEEVAYYANKEYSERKAAGQDWVLPSVCVSQACLESGYGEATTVNIFGIKGKGTVARTSEEYTPGTHTSINASFVSHGTIAEDVHLYYDLICGTGNYEGWDIYSKARNNEDAAAAIAAIRAAGYATSSSYTENVQAILNNYNLRQFDTGMFDIEYNESGYIEGVNSYEQAKKLLMDLQTAVETAKTSIESACNNKPQVDYKTIIEIDKMSETIETMIDLLDRVKGIADNEKYVAEQYNEDGGGSLDQFQAAALMAGTVNFSFDQEDFKAMVSDFKENGSNKVFKEWFEGYVTDKGISSKVVNMSQYQAAIKETGAVASSDYVVSKVQFAMAEKKKEDTGAKETDGDTKSKTGSPSSISGSAGNSSSHSSSSSQFSPQYKNAVESSVGKDTKKSVESSIVKDGENIVKSSVGEDTKKAVEETIKSKDEKSTEGLIPTPTPTNTESSENTFSNDTPKPEAETTHLTVIKEETSGGSSYSPINEATNSIAPAVPTPTPTPTPEPTLPTVTPSPTQTLDDPQPTYSPTITKIPPSSSSAVSQKSSSGGGTALAVGLGLGATAAAVAGGAYYMKTKDKKNELEEYNPDEIEITDDYEQQEENVYEDPMAEQEHYKARSEDKLSSDGPAEDYMVDPDDDDTSIPTYQSPGGNKFN